MIKTLLQRNTPTVLRPREMEGSLITPNSPGLQHEVSLKEVAKNPMHFLLKRNLNCPFGCSLSTAHNDVNYDQHRDSEQQYQVEE